MGFGGAALAMLLMAFVATAVLCFLIGAMSPAVWIGRAFGKDVRGAGSGNPGATNVGRVLGIRWGVLVGALDVLKGFLPCWLLLSTLGWWYAAVGGVFVVLGHVFSPFLRGRGGKGVATTLGVLLALAPWLALVAIVVFAVGFAVLRRVGEASALAAVALLVAGLLVTVDLVDAGLPERVGLLVVVLAVIVLVRLRRNLVIAAHRWRRTPGRPH